MLFSCLVDADRLDTEAFSNPDKAGLRRAYPTLDELHKFLTAYLDRLSRKVEDTPVNRLRGVVLEQCRRAAELSVGLFSLTVPTGGGKTLSSLAFALAHALRYGLERVIYIIPYTSIIEQNAKVFRECLGKDAVIDTHSTFDPPDDTEDGASIHSLAAENWDAPLICTTAVQFFDSLFSHKASRCRKLHNIIKSVVILDESQMLPPELLRPCIESLRELAERYHTSVVLCTATQPALCKHDEFKDNLENVREIIYDPRTLYGHLRRVTTNILGRKDNNELTGLLREHERVLCIVNTRKSARTLFELLCGEEGVYHLSAAMCPAHRTLVLEKVRDNLRSGHTCRVVSTQLVEAGVDIDFPVVFREISGIDSIAQAAGRCNREGKLPHPGKVYVFESPEGVPRMFRMQKQASDSVFRKYPGDILSLEAVREYFQELYWQKGEEGLDTLGIYEKLAAGLESVTFPFREIGEAFRLIKDDMLPVIIPWGEEGQALKKELCKYIPSKKLHRKVQRFAVTVYWNDLQSLMQAGAVEQVHEQYTVLLNERLYSEYVGLIIKDEPHLWNSSSVVV